MKLYILIAIIFILYYGFSSIRKANSLSNSGQSGEVRQNPYGHMETGEASEEENHREKWEKKENFTVKVEVQPVRPAKSEKPASSPLPQTKRKLTEWQKAWLMKEIVDQPRALRPYRFRQPR